MNVIAYIVGTLVVGLFGALSYLTHLLSKSRDKSAELEMKLSQADYDQDVADAKKKLEALEKEE